MKSGFQVAGSVAMILLFAFDASAQAPDSLKKKFQYPNTLKLNLTSMIEFRPAVVVAYERMLRPSQSIAAQAGFISFPTDFVHVPDGLSLSESKERSGFRVGVDYRFYFKNENKYDATRGLYWGPFIDYMYFKNNTDVAITDTSLGSGTMLFDARLRIAQAGVNLGYQFIIKQRLSIDLCLFGPAIAYYRGTLHLSGDFASNQENEIEQELLDYIFQSFPMLGDLVSGQEVSSSGLADLFFAGFRYSINIGFRF